MTLPRASKRVGHMMEATKKSCKRVQLKNGKYHYPKIPENQLRRKGELYFQPMQISGLMTSGVAVGTKSKKVYVCIA